MRFIDALHANQGVSATLMCLMVFVWILFKIRHGRAASMKKLPLGPPSWPIIGHLHLLGKLPHRSFFHLSQKYGPLVYLRLGCVPTVVASSAAAAKEILKTHDHVFASRPPRVAAKQLLYNSTDVGFSPYGSYWRQMRKICKLRLLCPARIESFQSVRTEEISLMIHSFRQNQSEGLNPVNLSKALSTLSADITCRMAFGRKYNADQLDGREFKEVIREFLFLLGAFNIGDFIPCLGWFDLQGLNRRRMKIREVMDGFLEKIIEEHEGKKALQPDLVDALLSISRDDDTGMEITRDNIKAVMLDMLLGGTDTSAGVLEWAMSELLRNPQAMRRAQDELEKIIGMNRMVSESDLCHLEYLQAVVKETLRLYPAAPLLIPHQSMEACVVSGFLVPAETSVIVNAWAIARDPKQWSDADMFKPERFIGSSIDAKGRNFGLIPFGSGRRICPGMQLGTIVVEHALAQLLHCFEWRLPAGMKVQDLDMREEFGQTLARAVHLELIPVYRLSL